MQPYPYLVAREGMGGPSYILLSFESAKLFSITILLGLMRNTMPNIWMFSD